MNKPVQKPAFAQIPALQAIEIARNPRSKWPKRGTPNRLEPVCLPEFSPSFTITPGESIFTIGSCFARNIEQYLKALGHKVPCLECDIPREELYAGTKMAAGALNKYTPASMLNEIRFALDLPGAPEAADCLNQDADADSWIDTQLHLNIGVTKDRGIERRLQIKSLVRDAILSSRVAIVTLGLVETWLDTETGLYMNETPPIGVLRKEPERYKFEVMSPDAVISCVNEIVRNLTDARSGDLKIVMTVSPIPFNRTFSGQDALTANMYSKSVLRVAAEVASRRFENVDYFPSYESVMMNGRDVWLDDMVHISQQVIEMNVKRMIAGYARPHAA